MLTASHYLLEQVLEQVSALNRQVASLEAQVKRGGGGGGRGGRGGGDGGGGSRVSQRKKKKVVVESDSELSNLEWQESSSARGGE